MSEPVTRDDHAEFKNLFPDYVLLFREGDVFAAYYEDAGICSLILGLTVVDDRVAFPECQLGGHEAHFRRAGYKTCLCYRGVQ